MAFKIQDFKNQLVYGGARPSLFQIEMDLPTQLQEAVNNGVDGRGLAGAGIAEKISFMCNAASIPASKLGMISVPYFGRKVKVAGNRTFDEPWRITILNDEDFLVRNAIESWMNAINSNVSNIRNSAAASPSSYTVDAVVDQYGKTGNIIKSYKFVGLFPVDLAPIDLGWDNNDTIEEYSTTFAFQYWESNTTS